MNIHQQLIRNLSQTIDDFRNFLVPSIEVNEFDICESINNTLKLISPSFKSNDIKIENKCDHITIKSLQNELIQVLMNLLKNSKDVLIENNIQLKYIEIKNYTKENFIFIEVKDNAGCVDEKIIDKIFEPYFTTKHKAQGTGIGLYMSSEITHKKLKGELFVENIIFNIDKKEYKGAKFSIKLPIKL